MGACADREPHRGRPATLSVVVPVFNTPGPLLTRALDSLGAVAAAGVSLEAVLVDDGCDAATAREIAAGIERLEAAGVSARLCRHDTNQGLAQARNTGIAATTGAWVMFLDSDDALVGAEVARFLAEADPEGPEVVCFLSAFLRAGEAAVAPAPVFSGLAKVAGGALRPAEAPALALVPSSWAQAYRGSWLRGAGPRFDPRLRRWEDRPFFVAAQITSPGGVAVYPHVLHHHHLDTGGSITKRARDGADAAMMLGHIEAVQGALAAAGLGATGFGAQHWWISLSRLLSVAAPGAVGNAGLEARVAAMAARLVAEAPRDPRGGGLLPPDPALPIARLPAPLRAGLIALLARPELWRARMLLRMAGALLTLRRGRAGGRAR